jgi:uncharacterized iron-regulated membrane protein
MCPRHRPSAWARWVHQPHNIWFRKALFQVHLWSGIGIGLYVLLISVTGSVLVYRDELYLAATPKPTLSIGPGPQLTDDQLKDAAIRVYAGYRVASLSRGVDQAVDIELKRGDEVRRRLFDPVTGNDLGESVPLGLRLIPWLLDLHDNLLAGSTGRSVNGIGAVAILALAGTGLVIWWPGIKTWPRSLTLHRGVGWKRLTWDLHSMLGFWSIGFILLFAISGVYLSFAEFFADLALRLESVFPAVHEASFWLAILHFGRIKGIGFLCSGPGLCDQLTKATWAILGLAPAAMFITGAIMWWNRVLRPRWQAFTQPLHYSVKTFHSRQRRHVDISKGHVNK